MHACNAKAASLGVAVPIVAGLLGCSATPSASISSATAQYEDIFVLRSERTGRVMPSSWCTQERAGFAPLEGPSLLEDRFNFWSVETRAADGRISNTHATNLGEALTCFGLTPTRGLVNFYIETTLGGLTMSGKGECTVLLPDVPEKGMAAVRCTVPLKVVSDAYSGGLLVTNTMNSKQPMGLQTDPPGYTQASIATIRLWRKH